MSDGARSTGRGLWIGAALALTLGAALVAAVVAGIGPFADDPAPVATASPSAAPAPAPVEAPVPAPPTPTPPTPPAEPAADPLPEIGEAFGVGGLGPHGTGAGGGRPEREPIGLGNSGRYGFSVSNLPDGPVPRLRPGAIRVTGGLRSEVARRVVLQHANEIRHCYQQALLRAPELEGQATLVLTIAEAGGVTAATVAESTLATPPMEECLTRAMRRWTFPAPTATGTATVTFPFTFEARR